MACKVLYYAFTFNLHLQVPKLKAKINTEISSTWSSDCALLLQPFFKAPKYLGCFYGLFTKKTVNKRKALHTVPSVGKDTNNKTI
jgi:hypothetical protein